MATFTDSIANMGEEPEVSTLIDRIEVMRLDADELATSGKHEEAIDIADRAAGIAFRAGNVVEAVRASCDAHRYNAHGKPLELFWKGYREFCGFVRNSWLQGRSEREVKWVNDLLSDLAIFGEDLATDRASEAPKG